MPTLGDVIANAFERPVFFFSEIWSQTFFPHFCPPNENPPIFFGFANQHFLPLVLSSSDEFPAPTLLNDWALKATVDALKWRGKYTKCFELTVKSKRAFPTESY